MSTAFITGSNRGIGLELTRQLAAEGWRVYATCRNPENAHDLNRLVADYPDLITVHPLDVCNEVQLASLKAQLKGVPIDILINNSGVHAKKASRFGETDLATWEEAARVNIMAPMKIMEALVDNVAASEKRIIASISSKMGSIDDNGSGGSYAYRSTKAALNAVMVSAAHDLRPRGIITLILHPGWVRTRMGGPKGEISVEESAQSLRKILDRVSLRDSGKFFDIDGSIIPW